MPYLFKKLSAFFIFLSTFCIAVDVITLLGGVISRYLFGASPIWVDELSRYLMISGVMLISGVVLLEGEHMRLNIIEKVASSRLRHAVKIYQNLVITAVCLFMSWFGFTYALSIEKFTTMGLSISKTIPMLALPVGFVSLLACAVIRLLASLGKQEETV